MKNFIITTLLCITAFAAHAQLSENQGWLFITHTQKLNQKFDLLIDAQTRTANQFNYINTLLLRSALSYNINKKQSFAVGYARKADREEEPTGDVHSLENRIYQQYLYNFKIYRIESSIRLRQEQRWVKEEKTNFSQRSRLFFSLLVPLVADTVFKKGLYANVQNELFLNVKNKHKVNGSFFDQNRLYTSIGYRWNEHIDTELGYMYWFQKEFKNDYRRNVLQLMVTTNF